MINSLKFGALSAFLFTALLKGSITVVSDVGAEVYSRYQAARAFLGYDGAEPSATPRSDEVPTQIAAIREPVIPEFPKHWTSEQRATALLEYYERNYETKLVDGKNGKIWTLVPKGRD